MIQRIRKWLWKYNARKTDAAFNRIVTEQMAYLGTTYENGLRCDIYQFPGVKE